MYMAEIYPQNFKVRVSRTPDRPRRPPSSPDLTPRGVARPQSFGMGCGAAANWAGIAAMTFVTLVASNALIFSLFVGISLGAALFVCLFVRETKFRNQLGN